MCVFRIGRITKDITLPKFEVLTTSNFDVVTTKVDRRYIDAAYMFSTNVRCVYRPKFDVATTSSFDVVTTEVNRRYIDVAYILSTYIHCVPT